MVLGVACPWGFVVVNKIAMFIYDYIGSLINLLALITVGFFIIICFLVELYISCYVGIVAMPVMIIYYVIKIIKICKTDYTREAKGEFNTQFWIYPPKSQKIQIKRPVSQTEKDRLIKEYSKSHTSKKKSYNDFDDCKLEEEFYCERCLKKISEEEYEFNDCMCEECYEDVYFYNMEE
jgi:hypothetical protein